MKVSRNPKVTVEGALRVGPDAEEVDLAKDLLAPLAVVVGRERKRPIRLVRFLGFCEFCHASFAMYESLTLSRRRHLSIKQIICSTSVVVGKNGLNVTSHNTIINS
jgi:hypothetical protein